MQYKITPLLLLSFCCSLAVHTIGIIVGSMRYREQIEQTFAVSSKKKNDREQSVTFATVRAPSYQPTQPSPKKSSQTGLAIATKEKKVTAAKQEEKPQAKEKLLEKTVPAAEPVAAPEPEQKPIETKKTKKKKEASQETKKSFSENDLRDARFRNEQRRAAQKKHEEFLLASRALKEEIQRHWTPPLLKTTEPLVTKVLCTLSRTGLLEEAKILESSTIIAYDVSVLKALKRIRFPETLWGKQFFILFS